MQENYYLFYFLCPNIQFNYNTFELKKKNKIKTYVINPKMVFIQLFLHEK